jgi:peptide/nickel transport system substrate-binding protein
MAGLLSYNLANRPVSAQDASTVIIGGIAEDANLDPNSVTATDWIGLLLNMYDTLVVRDAQGNVAPSLATAWRQIDPLTWEFTTRENVSFQGGQPFGPEDVAFTYSRVMDKTANLPQSSYLSSVDSVTVTGPNTLQIHLKFADPVFLQYLLLVPIVDRKATRSSLARQTNGTGPYTLEKWTPGDQLSVRVNPKYWGKPPAVKRVVFRSLPEANSLVAALQSGEIDIAVGLQPDVAATLNGAAGFDVKNIDTDRNVFIILDNTVKPLDDHRVRHALNISIDREALVRDILLGNGVPTASQLGPMYLGSNTSVKPVFDPEGAKRILAEAGYPDGIDFTFNSTSGRYMKDRELSEALVGQWARVGIRAKLVLMEFGTLMTGFRTHKLSPAYLIGVSVPILDAGRVGLQSYFTPAYPQAYFRDPKIESDINAAVKMTDEKDRRAAVENINAELYNEDAFVYLYQQKAIFGIAKRLTWTPRSDEKVRLVDIALK